MRVPLLILAVAAKFLVFTIKQSETTELFTSRKPLQFDNFTGIGVRQEHITAFTNFANSASAFYKEDVEANARYIKEQMDVLFGVPGRNFLVMIQTDQARSGWLIWVSSENIIASLTGINRINTNWSYIFLKFLVPSTLDDYHLII